MKKTNSGYKSLKNKSLPAGVVQEASATVSFVLDVAEKHASSLEEMQLIIAFVQKIFRGQIYDVHYERMDMMEDRYKTMLPPICSTSISCPPVYPPVTGGGTSADMDEPPSDLPSADQMSEAISFTVKQGMWWSNRSWAVVCRVYQMKGFFGSISDFVNEAAGWPVKIRYKCNYDAVQKAMAKGTMIGDPVQWERRGAPKQAVILAQALLSFLGEVTSAENA